MPERLYMAPQIVCGDGYKADADMYSVGVMVLEMFTLSRIPDAQAQGGDRGTDISTLLGIWYHQFPDIARQREDALHDDVRATLGRRVSRRWSDAVSKLVVGCLRYSRDVRLTSAEAAALLAPCSRRESSADGVSESERESESDDSGLEVALCCPQGTRVSGDCVAPVLQAGTTGDTEDESRRAAVVFDMSSCGRCSSGASGDETTSASSGGTSDELSEAGDDGASSLEIVMAESPVVGVAESPVAGMEESPVVGVAESPVAGMEESPVERPVEERIPGAGGFPSSPAFTATSFVSLAAAASSARSGESVLQLVSAGQGDDDSAAADQGPKKLRRGRAHYWVVATLLVVGVIIAVFYIRKATKAKTSKPDS